MLTREILDDLFIIDVVNGTIVRKKTKGHFVAGSKVGRVIPSGYLHIKINYKLYYAHRIIWFYHYGHWPTLQLDHINGNKLDNRISNLREVECHQNAQNKKESTRNQSGKSGVNFSKFAKKWQARISTQGNHIFLGYFETKQEAIDARIAAEQIYHPYKAV